MEPEKSNVVAYFPENIVGLQNSKTDFVAYFSENIIGPKTLKYIL